MFPSFVYRYTRTQPMEEILKPNPNPKQNFCTQKCETKIKHKERCKLKTTNNFSSWLTGTLKIFYAIFFFLE